MNKLLTAALVVLAAAVHGATPAAKPARAPEAAGRFYPADPGDVARQADSLLAQAPIDRLEGEAVAALMPHAGWEFAGPAMARVAKALSGRRFDAVVIVGTGHYKALSGAAIYPGDYATAEGAFRYDEGLAKALTARTPLLTLDAAAHRREHSIEVVLPLLRRALGDFKLVAVLMNATDLSVARQIGAALAAAAAGRRVLIVASSDLSHYPSAGVARTVDSTTLLALESLDTGRFWLANRVLMARGLSNLAVTYCGEGAVTAVAEAARRLGAGRLQVLARSSSADATGESARVVGYAGALFVKAAPPPPAALSDQDSAALLDLARRVVAAAVSGRRPVGAPLYPDQPQLNLPGAAFVTLRGPHGALRGCVGATQPTESLSQSVARRAAQATRDGRFPPVRSEELAGLSIELSVLSQPRPVESYRGVKPGDGVILSMDNHEGVFLPEVWSELRKPARFFAELCRQKAGLSEDCYKDRRAAISVFSTQTAR